MTGVLRVGVLPTLGPYLLPELLPDIRARYPKLQLYVREEMWEALLSNLHHGKYDAVFTSLPLPGESLRVRRLFWEPVQMAIPCEHPLASKHTVSVEDLKGQAVLTLEPRHVLHRQIREICEQYGAELQVHYEGTSLDTLRIMVSVGMGIAFLPALYVRSEMPKATNVRVTISPNTNLGRTIGLVWRSSSPQSSVYEEFSDDLKQIIERRFRGIVRTLQ
jgi:LysR family hydrogen peroxide-inducible transcriptional activator